MTLFDAGGYGNLNRQVSQLEDVIQRKVNAIVLVPASSVGTVPAVEKAVDAGIGVINDGIATKSPKVTGFVGENSYLMGQLEAVYMADALGGKGKVVMLSGPSGLDLTNFRVNGFKDYMKYYPEIKIVAEKFSGTASAEALNIMQDYLQSFPDVRGVYTFNGPIAIGCSKEFVRDLTTPEINGAGALMDYCCYGANLAARLLGRPESVTGMREVIDGLDLGRTGTFLHYDGSELPW